MSQPTLDRFRDATATPPPGAKERVWRQLQAEPSPARRPLTLVFAFAAAVLLGVGLVSVLRPQPRAFELRSPATIAWAERAIVSQDGAVLSLRQGALAVSSWSAPVEIHAGEHVLVVESGVALLRVASERVELEVFSGTVVFDGSERRRTRDAVIPPLVAEALRREPPAAHDARALYEADRAVEEARFDQARAGYHAIAQSSSLAAEVAQFKEAELVLRRLQQAQEALTLFEAGDARFPQGALAQERALSAIESCVFLKDWKGVADRTSRFLERHPSSERLEEVRRLHDEALRSMNVSEGSGHSLPDVAIPKGTRR